MRARSVTDPRGPGLLMRAALTALLVALSLVLAAPAQAAETVNCTPMSDPACKDLTPIVECVWSNGNGTSDIAWGYNNPSTKVVHIDIGNKNKMAPSPDDRGQPTDFEIGMHHNVFVTTVTGSSLEWRLGNNKESPSGSTPACLTKPVSVVGSVHALLVGIALMLAVALPVAAVRRDRRGVPA